MNQLSDPTDLPLRSPYDPEWGFCFPISIEGVSQNRRRRLHLVVSTSSDLSAPSERAPRAGIPLLAVWDPMP